MLSEKSNQFTRPTSDLLVSIDQICVNIGYKAALLWTEPKEHGATPKKGLVIFAKCSRKIVGKPRDKPALPSGPFEERISIGHPATTPRDNPAEVYLAGLVQLGKSYTFCVPLKSVLYNI